MIQRQIIYLPVKVEDELPEKEVVCVNISNDLLVGNIYNIGDNEFQCEDEYQILAQVWLKPKEAFAFTPEQLNEYTANVIRQALETAVENVKLKCQRDPHKKGYPFAMVNPNGTKEVGDLWITANKQSIMNTFEETFKKFEV